MTFRGRLFYSIFPDKIKKIVTFYYTRANATEGRSVTRGLPLFIQDYFKLYSSLFCNSGALPKALDSEWNYAEHKFLLTDDNMEAERLN